MHKKLTHTHSYEMEIFLCVSQCVIKTFAVLYTVLPIETIAHNHLKKIKRHCYKDGCVCAYDEHFRLFSAIAI